MRCWVGEVDGLQDRWAVYRTLHHADLVGCEQLLTPRVVAAQLERGVVQLYRQAGEGAGECSGVDGCRVE